MELSDVTEKFLRSIDIRTVLPQQEPFVMVGKLTAFDLHTSTTETLIEGTNLFVDDGIFSPCGIMENIAQTCAARIGFYNKYILKKDFRIGFIGAISEFKLSGSVAAGDVLTTTVDVMEEIFGMTLASAQVRSGKGPVATATVKLTVKNVEQI